MNCQYCLAPLHKGPCQSWETGLAGNRQQQQRVKTSAHPPQGAAGRSGKPLSPAKPAPKPAAPPVKAQPAHQPKPQPTVRALLAEADRQRKAGNKATADKLRTMAYRLRDANKTEAQKRAYRRREKERAVVQKIVKQGVPGA